MPIVDKMQQEPLVPQGALYAHHNKDTSSSSTEAFGSVYPNIDSADQHAQKGTSDQWKSEVAKEKQQQEGNEDRSYTGEIKGSAPLIHRGGSFDNSSANNPSTAASDAPYARFRDGKFDLSPYVQPKLMDSIDRLTSPASLGFTLFKPAIKIAAKSLLTSNEPMSFSKLMEQTQMKTEPKDPKSAAASAAASSSASSSSSSSSTEHRTLFQRITYFCTMGLPLAILVGVLCGVRNFIMMMWMDLHTIIGSVYQLMNMAQSDYAYYSKNQNELPKADVVADAAVGQVLLPNARRLIYDKLGYFQFLGKPVVNVLESRVRASVKTGVQGIEKLSSKFSKKKSESQPQAQ